MILLHSIMVDVEVILPFKDLEVLSALATAANSRANSWRVVVRVTKMLRLYSSLVVNWNTIWWHLVILSCSCDLTDWLSFMSIVEGLSCLRWLGYLALDVVQNHLSNVLKRQFLISWSLLVALLLLRL